MRKTGAHERVKTKKSYMPIIIAVIAVLAVTTAVLIITHKKPVDPHEGQVYIDDGFSMVWMTPLEGVPASTLKREEFTDMHGRPIYVGTEYETMLGIDVSEHQHEIDWKKVASDGIQFAYIRAAYRGYTKGGLFEDPYFKYNITGALENGLKVGVYFFSQAITAQEAMEEADFILRLIKDYDVTLPVVFDWERMDEADSRTVTHDTQVLNDCAAAFCETVKQAGYEPAVYFNKHFGYYEFDLQRLCDYTLWLAQPDAAPDFYYAFDIWQSSFTADIKGIDCETDLDILFIPLQDDTEQNEQG